MITAESRGSRNSGRKTLTKREERRERRARYRLATDFAPLPPTAYKYVLIGGSPPPSLGSPRR